MRIGDWMQTGGGNQFWPLDPRPSEVHIRDIAGALSKLCRFGGHCRRFYSVAEHCVHMARAASEGARLTALLHDASEAYLSDVIRPIKPALTNYLAIEAALERAIAERFGLQWPWLPEIKTLDNAMLMAERDQAMKAPPNPWVTEVPPLGVELQFWTPARAEFEYVSEFKAYGGKHLS
jgi:hypothetical protein